MSCETYELLKKGCVSAFADIHALYNRRIYWIGRSLVKDSFVVETLVQDTFLKLWVNRESIEDPKHIFNFLRFVMTRECNHYYSRPKNKFYRQLNSLEKFDNYQDQMLGDDSLSASERLQAQALEQKNFERVKTVLPLLDDKKRHLINLCLQYGFRYKAISEVMGVSVTETSQAVKQAITDIKTIIHQGTLLQTKTSATTQIKVQGSFTEEQAQVLKLRCEKKYSFASIAQALNVSQKEVHSHFVAAYAILQEKHLQQQQSA